MVHTQWEKQTGLCLRKQIQQASAKSYSACFKDKKQKNSFLTERKRDGSLQKFSANFYFFLDSCYVSPFPFPHTLNQQTPMFTRIHPSVSPTSHAMQVQGEMSHCRCTGIPQCQLLCCKVMYK